MMSQLPARLAFRAAWKHRKRSGRWVYAEDLESLQPHAGRRAFCV